jgi:hypothetical protein
MAAVKKAPRAGTPISPSSMKAASCSFPMSARRGRPSGTRRTFGIAIDGTGCPSSRRSPWLHKAVGSGCTLISTCATSRAPKSLRFSASCSATCEVRSCSCGTAGKFIGVGMSRPFSTAIPEWRRTAFRATLRSSIPMSSSGRRRNASWRTRITTGSFRSHCTSCDPCSASVGRSRCFARASTHPIFRGRDPSGSAVQDRLRSADRCRVDLRRRACHRR